MDNPSIIKMGPSDKSDMLLSLMDGTQNLADDAIHKSISLQVELKNKGQYSNNSKTVNFKTKGIFETLNVQKIYHFEKNSNYCKRNKTIR